MRRWSSDDVIRLLDGDDLSYSQINDILRLIIEQVSYFRDEDENVPLKNKYK
ncbi:hypothetical protein ACQKOF_17130 [Lysinibacillus sp. NPDC093190]|uniref:hypothetical protein n=1 Tax=Lysinibacillus sp. NPDC093190 TaxID=3390575 RepID=UPI003D091CA9